MDRISGLSDDLLIKILSFLPTKVAVSTSILSTRWECLYMWLPKLEFVSIDCSASQCKSLRRFLNRNLPLHRAPVIESFCLRLNKSRCKAEDINLWVVIAVSRYLGELKIEYYGCSEPKILPSSLYACKSLVTLKLYGGIRLDVPRMVCLPSLKTLRLRKNKTLEGGSFRRLLSICPVLEDLSVELCDNGNTGKMSVTVPTLQSLTISIPDDGVLDELVINTPSLRYLKLEDQSVKRHSFLIENMPNLEEAYADVRFLYLKSLLSSITSVKCLTLCSKCVYDGGLVFNKLEHLKLCACIRNSMKLLAQLLKDSPSLQVVDIFVLDHYNNLASGEEVAIDESLMSSLKTFDWSSYLEKRDLEVNACCLKIDDCFPQKHQMIKELSLYSGAATTC